METSETANRGESSPAVIGADDLEIRRLIRGLSALFWGLPLALLFSFKTGTGLLVSRPEAITPIMAFALLTFGSHQLKSIRIVNQPTGQLVDWINLFALTNLGLSPFLYFWNQQPDEPYFSQVVGLLLLSGLLFVYLFNRLLFHLGNHLHEEPLRTETNLFSSFNAYCLIALTITIGVYFVLGEVPLGIMDFRLMSHPLMRIAHVIVLFFILLPLALTMTLTWRVKEALFDGLVRAMRKE